MNGNLINQVLMCGFVVAVCFFGVSKFNNLDSGEAYLGFEKLS
jgi:hypothetical protein